MTEKAILLIRIVRRGGSSRTYARPVWAANNRLRSLYALVEGTPEHHPEGVYYVRFTAHGKRQWRNVGSDSTQAVASLRRQVALIMGLQAGFQHHELPPPPPTPEPALARQRLDDAVRTYMLEIEARRAKRTAEVYRLALEDFAKACPEVTYLNEITRGHMLAFESSIRRKGNSARTAHGQVTSVNTFLRHWGYTEVLQKKDLPTYTEKLVDSYSTDELVKLLKSANDRERLLFEFFLGSGCREQEVMYLHGEDIDFASGVVRIREKSDYSWKVKDREERDIPISDDLLSKLRAHIAASPGATAPLPFEAG